MFNETFMVGWSTLDAGVYMLIKFGEGNFGVVHKDCLSLWE